MSNQKIKKILTALQQTENVEKRIELLYDLSAAYVEAGNKEEAIKSMEKALSLFNELPEELPVQAAKSRATILSGLGLLYAKDHPDKAIELYSRAMEIFQNLVEQGKKEFLPSLIELNFWLAETFAEKKDFYQSRKRYKTILNLLEKNPEQSQALKKAFAHEEIGKIFLHELKIKEAKEHLLKALYIYQELVSENELFIRFNIAATLTQLSKCCTLNNEHTDAIRYLLASLEQREILMQKDHETHFPLYASTLHLIGNIYMERRSLRDEMDGAGSFTGFGILSANTNKKKERDQKDKEKALHYYRQALQAFRELEKKDKSYTPIVANVIHDIGQLYDEHQDFEYAETYYAKALELRRKLAAENPALKPDLASTLLNLITLHWNRVEKKEYVHLGVILPLLDEAEQVLNDFSETDGIIGSMKSELAYYRRRFAPSS